MPAFTTEQYQSSFIHAARESLTDKYYVIVAGGDLKVFDRTTGAEHIVSFPDGKAYLTSTSGFKALTVGGTTYLVNLDTVVRRGTKKAPAQIHEALVYVRAADYGTTYTLTLNETTVEYTTPVESDPLSRTTHDTQAIALVLYFRFVTGHPELLSEFEFSVAGSSIHINRIDGEDFTLTSSDGLSDVALKIVKGSVQTFAELPEKAFDGMIVEVTGDPESATDNYWVRFDCGDAVSGSGVWRECAAPGTPVNLNANTMPWTLGRRRAAVDGLVDTHLLPMPSVTASQSTTFAGSFTSNPDTAATYTGESVALTNHGERLAASVGVGDGSTRTLTVTYDVDAGAMEFGENVTVELRYNTVLVASKTYLPGVTSLNETLQFTGAITAADAVQVQLQYASGVTPASGLARVTFHAAAATLPGIAVSTTTGYEVTFNATTVYPMGAVITLVANSLTFDYTVAGADATGLDIASALATDMSGDFTVVDGLDGSFTLSDGGTTPVTWTVVPSFVFSANYFFSPDIELSPDANVGQTIVNDTDGSSATITANSVHTIQTAGFSGGISNAVRTGDLLHVNTLDTNAFVFAKGIWDEREAGDLETCPLPSFVDLPISELFFHNNRLGFTAGENSILSESGVSSNFMRKTATQLLQSDVIDIKSAHPGSGHMEHAVEYNDALYLFTGGGHQLSLEGSPDSGLTPQSVSLKKKSAFPVSALVRPVVMGKYLYFARAKSTYTQMMQYFLTVNGKGDARDITESVPQYLLGAPKILMGDAALEMLFVVTDDEPGTIWVQSFHYDGEDQQTLVMSSWSKWTFAGAEILALAMDDGVLAMLMLRDDGAYLETLDLGVIPDGEADYRDRQDFETPVAFVSKYRFSTVFKRNREGLAETRGRLQLRFGSLNYHDTTDFTVTVTPAGRPPFTYTFTAVANSEGVYTFPILTRNTYATIEITSTNAGGFAFTGFDWEGFYTTRDQRV